MRALTALTLSACCAFGGASLGWAQEPTPPLAAASRPWSALRADQREILQTLGSQWQQLDASDQEKWLTVAARYPKLETEEQQRLQARMAQWAQMSPAQRTQVRIGWQDAQRVKPQERQAKWERYQALTEEQREALKLRASQRPARLIVPAAGQSLPPLMAQARAGVSTITPGSRSAPSPLHPLPLSRLDPQTLLPKSGAPHKQ